MKLRSYLFLFGALLGVLVSAYIVSAAANPFNITFPIPELNNCADQVACKAFCDISANASACLTFAKAHGLVSGDEADKAEKIANVKNGPGGCNSPSSCQAYCNDSAHLDECVAFGESHGFLKGRELEDAKKVQTAFKSGIKTPGSCQTKKQCEAYCSNTDHAEECLAFGKAAGFVNAEEATRAEKILPLMKNGETPGKCQSKDACETYCHQESHFEECTAFAEKVGFMTAEQAASARKTGGVGPGGCRGTECQLFCREPANQQTCFDFAKDKGLIAPEQLQRIQENNTRLNTTLEESPAIKQCISDAIGVENVTKIESGQFFNGQEATQKMRSCFEQTRSQGDAPEGAGDASFRGPGGCSSQEECKAFCSDSANKEECARFSTGPRMPMMPSNNEATRSPMMYPRPDTGQFIPSQQRPCNSVEECKKLCGDDTSKCKELMNNQFKIQPQQINQEELQQRLRNLKSESPAGKIREFNQNIDKQFFEQNQQQGFIPPTNVIMPQGFKPPENMPQGGMMPGFNPSIPQPTQGIQFNPPPFISTEPQPSSSLLKDNLFGQLLNVMLGQ